MVLGLDGGGVGVFLLGATRADNLLKNIDTHALVAFSLKFLPQPAAAILIVRLRKRFQHVDPSFHLTVC